MAPVAAAVRQQHATGLNAKVYATPIMQAKQAAVRAQLPVQAAPLRVPPPALVQQHDAPLPAQAQRWLQPAPALVQQHDAPLLAQAQRRLQPAPVLGQQHDEPPPVQAAPLCVPPPARVQPPPKWRSQLGPPPS